MMKDIDGDREDVELGTLEQDAFIPGPNVAKRQKTSNSILARWLPHRVYSFLNNLSRIKLMIIALVAFVLILAWIAIDNNRFVPISLSPKNIKLSKELVESLSNSDIPEYVLTYAPLVFLDKGDAYHPSDMATHISNTHPTLNFTTIKDAPDPLTLNNLDALNELGRDDVYLTSTSSVISYPKFLKGKKPHSKTLQTEGATSCAVIVVKKDDGIVDAFYMYFYTFNEGPSVVGHVIGNHLGDWEHNMVRFKDGVPQAVWYSQHEYGAAFSYDAVRKAGVRPLGYSAKGSHANYAVSGSHDLHAQSEEIPAHVAFDRTSPGRLWDPALSAYYYTYSPETKKFIPAKKDTPVNYLYFQGRWGDPEYAEETEGQEEFHGLHKWSAGPQGPLFKHLDRKYICLPNRPECVIGTSI